MKSMQLEDNLIPIEIILHQFGEQEEDPQVTKENLTRCINEAKCCIPALTNTTHIVNAKTNEGIKDLLRHWISEPEQNLEASLAPKQTVFPNSYSSLWATPAPLGSATTATVDHMKQMLLDYTKNNHGWKRFATFHWKRHHCKVVEQIISWIDTGTLTTPKDILDELNKIENFKPNGSLSRRIQFMEQQIDADSQDLMASS